ncbi:MAG TPA: beta-galactosidase [Anaerolineales bacterium]|nr:beta-galactosidase [Anaerolineales bacterium]
MTQFEIAHGQFGIDGKPTLLQAGEFHYFRTPAPEWAHRLGLLRAAGFNTLATYIPWLWHQPTSDVSDLDGQTHPMRDLTGFLDLAARMGFWIIARPGPYIMAETYREGIPAWVLEQHPECAFLSAEDARAQEIVSYLHPSFVSAVEGWYSDVFAVLAPRQVTRGGRILMVQLDNEMGMIAWVRNLLDVNPDTLARLAGHIEAAAEGVGLQRYSEPPTPERLRRLLQNPTGPDSRTAVEDYRRFYRRYLRDYFATLWDIARSNGLEVAPVVNIHGFGNGGKTFPIGLSQLIEAMTIEGVVSATDVYPIHIDEGNAHELVMVNAMTQALQNSAQALFSIEFQAGGNPDFGGAQSSLADLHARLCLSVGMRGINHYLFCDGENDPLLSGVKRHDWGHPVRKDGSVRSQFARYAVLSGALEAYGTALVVARPETTTTVGFLLDHYMTEVNTPATADETQILTHQRDTILFDLIARGLTLTHRAYDAIAVDRDSLDPLRTPTLWLMIERQCDPATQQKLIDYAQTGGTLILIGRMCQEDFAHRPCRILADALGVETITAATGRAEAQTLIHAFHHRDIPATYVETYTGAFDQVFAEHAAGGAVGFEKALGAGRVLVLGAAFEANTLDDLDVVEQLALAAGCASQVGLSAWADVRLSRGPEGDFVYLNNYQDDPVETTIVIAGHAAFGGQTVHIPARQGLILPLAWEAGPGVTIHYLTAEVRKRVAEADTITLTLSHRRFAAELSLSAGWRCESSSGITIRSMGDRVQVTGERGQLTVSRI